MARRVGAPCRHGVGRDDLHVKLLAVPQQASFWRRRGKDDGVSAWATMKRHPWTIYIVAAVIFFVAGGLLAWRSTTGVGVGYGLLVVAVMDLAVAWVLYRRQRGARQGDRQMY